MASEKLPKSMGPKKAEAHHLSDLLASNKEIPTPDTRHAWHSIHLWWSRLPDPLRGRVIEMGFGPFFSFEPFSVDEAMVATLSERWRDEYHSFHFPTGEMTITLEDVAMCWGLRVHREPVFTEGQDSDPSYSKPRFKTLFGHKLTSKAPVDLAWLGCVYGGLEENMSKDRIEFLKTVMEEEDEEEAAVEGKGAEVPAAGPGDGGDRVVTALEATSGPNLSGTAPMVKDLGERSSSAAQTAPPFPPDEAGSSDVRSRKRPREDAPLELAEVERREAGEGEGSAPKHRVWTNIRRTQSTPRGRNVIMTEDAHLRAFLLYFFGQCLFVNSSGGKGSAHLLALVEDLDKVKDKAWGAATLAYLFHELDDRVREGVGHRTLRGFVQFSRFGYGSVSLVADRFRFKTGWACSLVYGDGLSTRVSSKGLERVIILTLPNTRECLRRRAVIGSFLTTWMMRSWFSALMRALLRRRKR